MPGTSSLKRAYLLGKGYTGDINKMELAWLRANGATSSNLNLAWTQMLTAKGFTGGRNTAMYAWLAAKGLAGSLNAKLNAFWASGALP
jgi:hypothetical protein